MSEHSAFKRLHAEQKAEEKVEGLLEQMGLPEGAITFIRRNLRTIWIVTGCVVTLVVAVSLYGSYTSYRETRAASALTAAMKAGDADRVKLLGDVVDRYDSTDSGLWARIELANIHAGEGDFDKAVAELLIVKDRVAPDNPLMPLVLFKLAGLHERTGAVDKALAAYGELTPYQGFDAIGAKAMGRLYEQEGNTRLALAQYQKFLGAAEEEGAPGAADPDLEMIRARVMALRN